MALAFLCVLLLCVFASDQTNVWDLPTCEQAMFYMFYVSGKIEGSFLGVGQMPMQILRQWQYVFHNEDLCG